MNDTNRGTMNWEVKRIKDFASLVTEKSTLENKVALENIEEASGRFIPTDSEFDGNGVFFHKGDILYGKLRPYLRKVWLADKEGNAVGDIFVFRCKRNSCPEYLKWLFLSEDFTSRCNGSTQGAKMPRVDSEFILTLSYGLPPLHEQQRIAAYLDKQTAAIDSRIALLEQKKDKYLLLRKAIINEAVSPKPGWEQVRLKDIGTLSSGLSGKSGDDFAQDDDPNNKHFIPFTNIFNNDIIDSKVLGNVVINDGEEQNKVRKGDLFFLMSSEDYAGLGKNALLNDDLEDTYLNSFCKGFRITKRNVCPEFLNYLLNAHYYRTKLMVEGKGFTRMNLKSDKINTFKVSYPSYDEQQRIASVLDKKTAQIDAITAKITEEVSKLKVLRKAIINESVQQKQ